MPRSAELPELPDKPLSSGVAPGPERPGRQLQVALVGEVRGEIEPCGCPTLPYGGFVRRQRMLERLEARGPLLHVDVGELLLKGLFTNRSESREARAALLMHLSHEVGVDVWVPGPTDLLALGLAGLRDLARGATPAPPAISATWVDESGALILKPAMVVQEGELRIGVIGLSAPPNKSTTGVFARGVAESVREGLAALPADLDLVVAAGNIGEAEVKEAVEAAPGITLALKTKGEDFDDPRRVGNTLVIETPDRGRYLQVLELRLGSTAAQPVELGLQERDWRERRTLMEQARNNEQAAQDLVALEARFEEAGRGRNLGNLRSVPLAGDLDGEAAVSGALDRFKAATLERAEAVASAPPAPTEPGYASSGRCVTCHRDEFARWSLSDHARSWESLIVRGSEADPECIGCHSTGFGEPGGFGELSPANVRRYKGVQCESCHGPLRGHPEDRTVASRVVSEETCLGCHDEANSPGFDFGPYLRRSICQDISSTAPGGAP